MQLRWETSDDVGILGHEASMEILRLLVEYAEVDDGLELLSAVLNAEALEECEAGHATANDVEAFLFA